MKKLTYLLFCLIAGIGLAFAQTTRVTGKVLSADDGEPIIGASVVVKGTTTGDVTDINGSFTINVPTSAKTLVVSFVGMVTQEVAVKANLTISLVSDTQTIDEVVVTALGMRRDQKVLGYAASTVKSEDLSAAKSGSVMGGLSGKVAGVNIAAAGPAGTSQKVLIRGISSLANGSNNPLYIVDGVPILNQRAGTDYADFGNSANDINAEDVESVTILKGASATALYGSRAANGVIMITTKRASNEKLTVSYDGTFSASNVLRVMQTQDKFGQGWGTWDRAENGSWGPRLDGTVHEWGSNKLEQPMTKPFSYVKNNLRNFYKTGLEMNNTVSVRYGTDKLGLFASYGNVSSDGTLPNNADLYNRNTFSLRGNAKVDKLTLDVSLNYSRKDVRRTREMEQQLMQHAVDVDYSSMKDYDDERYNLDNYYTLYATNPYYRVDNFYYTYQDNHTYGKIEASYEIVKGLKATGRVGLDFMDWDRKEYQAKYSFTPGSYSALGGKAIGLGYYGNYRYNSEQLDATAFLSGDYKIGGDFSLNGTAGWNLFQYTNGYTGGYVNGLDVPGWYHLQNTASAAVPEQLLERKRLIGLFAQAELGYKDFVFLNLSGRNDRSSTLPVDKNSYFYGGANISVLLHEVLPSLKEQNIDFLKVRAAVGQTGNDALIYRTSNYFVPLTSSTFYYTRLPIGGVSGLSEYNRLASQNLKPEMTTEYELGLSANLFKNRIRFDFAYYDRMTKDQIISASLPPETGYTTETRNIGKIQNRGVEMLLGLTPVRTNDLEWEIGGTFTKNNSKVIELWGDKEEYTVTSSRTVEYLMIKGEPAGVFRIPDVDKVKDEKSPYNGYMIVNNNGYPINSPTDKKVIGSSQPDFILGLNTSVKYKSFRLGIVGDWHKGGWMYSNTSYISHFNGNSTQTVYNERNTFVYPHSVKLVNGQYYENNIPVMSNAFYQPVGNYSYSPYVVEQMVLPKDFFKIREVSLSYDVPKPFLAKTPLSKLTVSVVGRNLFLWTPKKNNYVDPEIANYGNDLESEFGETTSGTSYRSFGASLKAEF